MPRKTTPKLRQRHSRAQVRAARERKIAERWRRSKQERFRYLRSYSAPALPGENIVKPAHWWWIDRYPEECRQELAELQALTGQVGPVFNVHPEQFRSMSRAERDRWGDPSRQFADRLQYGRYTDWWEEWSLRIVRAGDPGRRTKERRLWLAEAWQQADDFLWPWPDHVEIDWREDAVFGHSEDGQPLWEHRDWWEQWERGSSSS